MKSGLAVGETYTGSDGTTLTFASDCETVETAAGSFEGCQLWVTKDFNPYLGYSTYKSYYKKGIGIVRHEYQRNGSSDLRVLKAYHIVGGDGLLPMASGNKWEYSGEYSPDTIRGNLKLQVCHADGKSVVLASSYEIERLKYDENSWLDMMNQIRNEYYTEENGEYRICDVSYAMERAEALARTPMEKVHTKVACSVARRIMETDAAFHPKHTATGHWNFFAKRNVQKKNGLITISIHPRWSFEWKASSILGSASEPLLYNDIYGILQDATDSIWSDEWKEGASLLKKYAQLVERPITTQIICEDGGSITTKAGTFDHCLMLSLDIEGLDGGLYYRGGKKKYYFADGIGIVRTENEFCDGMKKAVYELTSYQGVGDGYMPFADGMVRRYDAIGLTDGFVGAVEYTYVQDEEGQIVIFDDRIGIREIPCVENRE